MIDRLARLLFYAGLAMALVLGGVYVGWFRLPPVPQLSASVDAVRDWRQNWKSYLGVEPSKFIRSAPTQGAGLTVHAAEAQPGVTVMSGLWGGKDVGLALFSLDGKELHRWVARYSDLAPLIPPLPADMTPTNDWDTHVDAMELFPNGDAMFHVGGLGMVRMDRCNQVVWWLDYETHHSLARDDDGNYWVGGRKRARHTEATDRFPGLLPPYIEDTVVKVSPSDGKILQEISLLDAIYRSGRETFLFPEGDDPLPLRKLDPLHLNHVEPLTRELAPAFPMFAEGDLLVSVRVPSTIFVLDPATGLIKWAQRGPWFGQHDPHFLPNGRISVYDNRDVVNHDAEARGVPRRASRILQLDPSTGSTETIFEGTLAEPFFTDAIGQHQYQPNGNILITESWGGRVFEITPNGKKVWEYVNRIDPGRVALIEWARRFPESYGALAKDCPASAS